MKIIGHRGARHLAPENTLAGIEKAISHGVDELEFDIRQTKDGVLVLHHDSFLRDPSGEHTEIHTHTYADLLRHKSDLTALDMAIRQIAHRCPVIIETKSGVDIAKLVAMITYYRQKGWRPKELSVASFERGQLAAVRAALPDVPLVVNERWSSVRAIRRAREFHTRRISMNQAFLWKGLLSAMHRRGYQLSPYPVNNVRRAAAWQPYLYAIITDRPDLFEKKHP